MLCRKVDTKTGLVNGAIGTVLSITVNHVTVQFEYTIEPYKVEKVKSKFTVMKNFCVYGKQFPLILVFAVTIHKCQDLSLDCTIADLFDEVFCAGMAYIALSRVCFLSGLYLAAFDPKSILVSHSCLKEVNRLRGTYSNDLPQYSVPLQTRSGLSVSLPIVLRTISLKPKKRVLSHPPSPLQGKRDVCHLDWRTRSRIRKRNVVVVATVVSLIRLYGDITQLM